MRRPKAMLVAQSHTLDELFNSLVRRSHAHMVGGYLDGAERYMRLALKAQSQCRTTLEALAEIKSPRHVSFVRQANISNGPQQVNNGVIATHEKNLNQSNELLETRHGERLDIGKTGAAGCNDSNMATVGQIHRAKVRNR